jgi:DNA-binding NtrC family response regulator
VSALTFTKPILLVDDDPQDRLLFTRFFNKLGLKVIATADPEVAVAQIVAGDVGCIITDQAMQVSGHELLQIVQQVRSDIGVIFLSGAERPYQPLPPGVMFFSKTDKDGLAKQVLKCMAPWQR